VNHKLRIKLRLENAKLPIQGIIMTDFKSIARVAIVTGAGRGIGEGCAREFAKAGFMVVIAEKDLELGLKLETELKELGFQACLVETDVTQPSSIEALVLEVISRFGRIDVLVNNAGRNKRTPLLEMSQNDWDAGMLLNLSSVFWMCRAAMPHLVKTKGSIVNVSSLVGLQGQSEAVVYAAAKGGVIALTKTLALDFAPQGVRVNCICPGDIWTPQYSEWLTEQTDGDTVLESISARLPVGRLGTTQETAQAILFLATNGFANGVILTLDGGKSIG
jgi:NAD(P)-dependent dehydrogenase (short-subunit alcohol dehydrogenase family)